MADNPSDLANLAAFIHVSVVIPAGMVHTGFTVTFQPANVAAKDGHVAAPTAPPVAGVIYPTPSPMTACIAAWAEAMTARGKRPRSIKRFTDKARQCAAFNGWESPAEVSYAGAVAWLAAKRRDGWGASTYTQAVSMLRRFGRHINATANPLAALEGDGETGGEGSRAGTTAEARAMIAAAYARSRADGRARGNAGMFIGFLHLTGLRAGEAAAVTWGSLSTDGPSLPSNGATCPSSVLWTDPTWSKNKRRQPIYLPTQLADRLHVHRLTVPDAPADRIFPVVPNRHSWRKLREAAGIPEKDGRGRAYTMHSARKWLASTLDEQGASPGMVSAVLRHSNTLAEAVYVQKSDEAQVAVMATLPSLFPLNRGDDGHGKSAKGPCIPGPMWYGVPAKESEAMRLTQPHEAGLTGAPATAYSLAGAGAPVGVPVVPASFGGCDVEHRSQDSEDSRASDGGRDGGCTHASVPRGELAGARGQQCDGLRGGNASHSAATASGVSVGPQHLPLVEGFQHGNGLARAGNESRADLDGAADRGQPGNCGGGVGPQAVNAGEASAKTGRPDLLCAFLASHETLRRLVDRGQA